MNNFSENVSKLVKNTGKTIETVAYEMGLSGSCLGECLRGGNVRLSTAALIAEYFNKSLDELLGFNIKKPEKQQVKQPIINFETQYQKPKVYPRQPCHDFKLMFNRW